MTDPHKTQEGAYVETRGFPGWRYQMPLSGIVLGLSCVTFVLFFDVECALEEAIAAFLAACLSFLSAGLPQTLEFWKISAEVLNSEISRKRRQSGRREMVKAGLGAAIFFSVVFLPLVLHFFTSPVIWLSSVLGMIIGLSGSQFFFALHVQQWEKAHRVRLSRFTVWIRDERNRRVILEYGVRAEKT